MLRMQLFNDMNYLHREMDQLFRDFGFDLALDSTVPQGGYEVRDSGETFEVKASLPGIDVAKLDISVLGRQLTVAGEFTANQDPEAAQWHRRERRSGNFSRTLQLSANVDADKVEAGYQNGILQISLPKAASALPKKISVKAA